MSKITTRQTNTAFASPLPCEWIARWYDESTPEHCGYGATEQEAIADLQRLDQERYEAEYEQEEPWTR